MTTYHQRAVTAARGDRATSRPQRNPFVPGQGVLPPFLAGRDPEQALIRSYLDEVATGSSPSADIVLYGPRGNGKTVLLEWSSREARARKIHTIDFVPAGAVPEESLLHQLSVLPGWLQGLSGGSVLGTAGRSRHEPQKLIASRFLRKARRGPLLVTIDEAHTMGGQLGQEVLNAVQLARRRGLPAMLLLAGTPDLPRHLESMGASFWNRSEQLPIGRLEPSSAADAIRIPLEERRRSIASGALAEVVDASNGYPFFVQVWGKLIWEAGSTHTLRVSRADVGRVRPEFERRRDLFCHDLYDELWRAGLAAVAAGLASVFADSEQRPRDVVERAVRASLEQLNPTTDRASAVDALDRLVDLGYIWPVVHRTVACYEPGIPSLMGFVERNENVDRRGIP